MRCGTYALLDARTFGSIAVILEAIVFVFVDVLTFLDPVVPRHTHTHTTNYVQVISLRLSAR